MRTDLNALQKLVDDGGKIAMLTCYDASFAALLENAGIDALLVGDSLGNVIQGHETTLPVTLRDMEYHTANVARGAKHAFIISDMPFGAAQISPAKTFAAAARLMAAGAHMVKIEGGAAMADTVAFLTARGIPVCGHLGYTPQSVHQLGHRVQGRGNDAAARVLADALALQQAGIAMLVLEMVPADLARAITEKLTIPTIGIGAGAACDGQVLVLYDLLDIYPGRKARFVKNFLDGEQRTIAAAVAAYVYAVKQHTFPTAEHSF